MQDGQSICDEAFGMTLHGALALLLHHIGVPEELIEELIQLLHTLSYGSTATVRTKTVHGLTQASCLHKGPQVGEHGACGALPPYIAQSSPPPPCLGGRGGKGGGG